MCSHLVPLEANNCVNECISAECYLKIFLEPVGSGAAGGVGGGGVDLFGAITNLRLTLEEVVAVRRSFIIKGQTSGGTRERGVIADVST